MGLMIRWSRYRTVVPPTRLIPSIPRAKLLVVEGMGHGIAYPALWDEIVDAITKLTRTADSLKS